MQKPTLNLRERNRLEAWQAIHNSAAELVLENGWTATTVEEIAARAGVSTRTFFNYFPSKEDAVLGVQALRLPQESLDAFYSSDLDIFERTAHLMIAVVRTSAPDEGTMQRRFQLLREIPELKERWKKIGPAAGELIEPILAQEFTTSPHTDEDPHDSAKALLLITGAIFSFAFSKNPSAFSTLGAEQLTQATATFRKVMKSS